MLVGFVVAALFGAIAWMIRNSMMKSRMHFALALVFAVVVWFLSSLALIMTMQFRSVWMSFAAAILCYIIVRQKDREEAPEALGDYSSVPSAVGADDEPSLATGRAAPPLDEEESGRVMEDHWREVEEFNKRNQSGQA